MRGLHQKNITRTGLIAMSLTLLSGMALGNPTLGVENDAEYASMIEAMRAAEYVRTDMILAIDERPRLYAGLAGLIAFSERNPDASDEQLSAFGMHGTRRCPVSTQGTVTWIESKTSMPQSGLLASMTQHSPAWMSMSGSVRSSCWAQQSRTRMDSSRSSSA